MPLRTTGTRAAVRPSPLMSMKGYRRRRRCLAIVNRSRFAPCSEFLGSGAATGCANVRMPGHTPPLPADVAQAPPPLPALAIQGSPAVMSFTNPMCPRCRVHHGVRIRRECGASGERLRRTLARHGVPGAVTSLSEVVRLPAPNKALPSVGRAVNRARPAPSPRCSDRRCRRCRTDARPHGSSAATHGDRTPCPGYRTRRRRAASRRSSRRGRPSPA